MRSPALLRFRTSSAVLLGLLLGLLLLAAPFACRTESPRSDLEDLLEEGRAALETRSGPQLLIAVERFEAAAALDPESARAWSGLADASALLGLYSVLPPAETMPRAARAAERALELDPDQASTHASLGLVRYLYDWRWAEAERHFRSALALDPDVATVHHWYAMMLTALGRSDEAVEQAERAVAAGPNVRIVQIKAATVFTAARRFERADEQLASCVERYPDTALAHRELGYLRVRQGRIADAISAFERARELDGGQSSTLAGLGLALALDGRPEDAHALIARIEEGAGGSSASAFDLAIVHAGLGQVDRAFERLEQAFAIRDPAIVYLTSKPGLDRLADDPRYADLARRVGLPISEPGESASAAR